MPDGKKYEEKWMDKEKHDQVLIHFPGEKMVGEFKNDEPWLALIFDKDGEMVNRISFGLEYK